MLEPVHIIFPVMDNESFKPPENPMKDTSPKMFEIVESPIQFQISCENSDIKDIEITSDNLNPKAEIIRRKSQKIHHLVVTVPPNEEEGNYITPFQFDRLAPARISTSPTLRRLRKSTPGYFTPLQDIFDVSKFPTHKEQSDLEGSPGDVCETPPWRSKYPDSITPPSCDSPLLSSSVNDVSSVPQGQAEYVSEIPSDEQVAKTKQTENENLQMTSEKESTDTLPPEDPSDPENVNRCHQMKQFRQSRSYERRRSSVVLSLPGLEVFPGDLLVSDGASDYMYHTSLFPNTDIKKSKWPFSKKGSQFRGKQKQMSDLENCLSSVKIPDFTEYEFYSLKDKTWNEFVSMRALDKREIQCHTVRRFQESVWELFTSECTYFLDHLLVLKMVFLNTLKYLQSHDHLMDVESARLFANLEELSQESLNFATCLLRNIENRELGATNTVCLPLAELLSKYFKESLCLTHQIYCLNYTSAVVYLENIKQRDDFSAYQKWCEQQEHCKRLHLSDLLVAPLHRLTRYPLILKNIWKRSTDPNEKLSIYSMKERVEDSLRDLEGSVKWLDKSQKFKQLQEVITWPFLWERDKRFFVPEGFKHVFKETNVENMLSHPSRHLLHEGRLLLTESTRNVDVYMFLFDDFLLITKIKRNKRKSTHFEMYSSLHPELQSVIKDGGHCKVLDQPIPLDRLSLKSIDQFHVTVYGMRNAFLIQHENRYQQCIAAFILQAPTESAKKMWMSQIEAAISSYTEAYETKRMSLLCQPSESAEI
ncbi:pleckstrin homology domain-containing family G member 7 isoform X1 [Pelobates cultripes]|uniref:Pleckstrin homology domain-containing family G member 7 isoform X1 n=1 Tax=Pelobates cultripes TaxID=61616 RepID=A0AAD1RUM3_PELCU|nr:pleckstrin homology domain-containing family G member 7 isoform X1 [Pelobates cultripes]